MREKGKMVFSCFFMTHPGSHVMGRTSECNTSTENQKHSNLLKGCTIVFFLSFKMFVYQNLLGVVLNGHCCVYQGYWKETWCRNENSHWIDCSSWYLLVWNLERLQLQSTENDCPLFYQTEFLKYCVWWCKGGRKRPHSDDKLELLYRCTWNLESEFTKWLCSKFMHHSWWLVSCILMNIAYIGYLYFQNQENMEK